MEHTFESLIPLADLGVVLSVCAEHGVDPTSSSQSEIFFAEVVRNAHENRVDLSDAVRDSLVQFRSVSEPPSWIQNPDWQFADGRPMVFVGQIKVSAQAGCFHDDASFYVFWDPETGETNTLIQVA
jgi:hypothetical protein